MKHRGYTLVTILLSTVVAFQFLGCGTKKTKKGGGIATLPLPFAAVNNFSFSQEVTGGFETIFSLIFGDDILDSTKAETQPLLAGLIINGRPDISTADASTNGKIDTGYVIYATQTASNKTNIYLIHMIEGRMGMIRLLYQGGAGDVYSDPTLHPDGTEFSVICDIGATEKLVRITIPNDGTNPVVTDVTTTGTAENPRYVKVGATVTLFWGWLKDPGGAGAELKFNVYKADFPAVMPAAVTTSATDDVRFHDIRPDGLHAAVIILDVLNLLTIATPGTPTPLSVVGTQGICSKAAFTTGISPGVTTLTTAVPTILAICAAGAGAIADVFGFFNVLATLEIANLTNTATLAETDVFGDPEELDTPIPKP